MSYTKITPTFDAKFGLRPLNALLTRLNKAIVLRKADDLQFAKGNANGGQRYLHKCLDLVAAQNEWVEVSSDASLNKGANDTALECWVKLDVNSNYTALMWREVSDVGEKLVTYYDGKIHYIIQDGVDTYTAKGGTDIRDGKWHHIFAYADRSSEAYVFLDGVDDTDSRTGTITDVGSLDNAGKLYIGGVAGAVAMTGQMDEARSWEWTGGIPADIDDAIVDNYKCPYEISPKLSSSDLVLHFKFDDSSGSVFTDETANNNDGDAFTNGALGNRSDLQANNALRASYEYENETPHAGTRAFRLKCFWDADDNENHCLYYWFSDGNNYIKLEKNSSNNLVFTINASGVSKSCTIDVSALWNTGNWYDVVCVWNLATKFDGTNYIKIYVDSSNTNANTEQLGIFDSVGSNYRIGYDGSSIVDAILAFQIDNIPWFDTIANAETAEFSQDKSVEYWHNSGSFNLPVVDVFTKACLLDELDSSYKPQIGYGIFNVLLSEDTETTDSSTHKKARVTAKASQFYEGQRLLIGIPITYDNESSWTNWCETAKINTGGITDNGDDTITLTFTAAFNATKRVNYTTANGCIITNNLVFDGNSENYGTKAWTATNCDKLKDGKDVFNGSQSSYLIASGANGYVDFENINVIAGENYLLSAVSKVDSGNGMAILVYDVTNSANIKMSNNFGNTDYNLYEMSFEVPATCTEILIRVIVRDSGECANVGHVAVIKNLVDNGGFEGTYAGSVAPGWTQAGTSTLLESADEHGGDKAQSINGDASNNLYQDVTVVSGHWYTLTGWINGTASVIELTGAVTKTLSCDQATYRKISYTFKALSTNLKVEIYGNGAVSLFDDLSLIQLSFVEAATSTPSALANCFDTDKWGNASRAFVLHGGSTIKYAASGVLNTGLGTIVSLFKAPFAYNKFDGRDFYLFDIENVFQMWYDASEEKFKFQIYDGSWQTVESEAQTFSAGDWIYIFGLFDNENKITIYVNAIQGTELSTTWDEQTLAAFMFLWSDHNGENQGDYVADYPHGFNEYLSKAQVESVVNGNWGSL